MAHEFDTNDFKLWNDKLNGIPVNLDEVENEDIKEIISNI